MNDPNQKTAEEIIRGTDRIVPDAKALAQGACSACKGERRLWYNIGCTMFGSWKDCDHCGGTGKEPIVVSGYSTTPIIGCPRDTDGDGNCGMPACPICGVNAQNAHVLPLAAKDQANEK